MQLKNLKQLSNNFYCSVRYIKPQASAYSSPSRFKMNTIEECPVCIEKYNKVRRPVECAKCMNTSCHRCLQRYITETIEDPHCMHCKHPFDRQFLNANLTKAFMGDEYVHKRREILWNREESFIPAAIPFVVLDKEAKAMEIENKELQKLIDEMQAKFHSNHRKVNIIRSRINSGNIESQAKATEVQQKFVRKCIKDGCRGWLSTGWKCDICDTKVCSDCYQIKSSADHECKKEDKETADYIRKNAKNCPKCGEMIEKKDGCDQMFCTSCHTAFSWKTLEIVKGAIHNPHYFAWRQATGAQERTVGDMQCGGVPDINNFNNYSNMMHKYTIYMDSTIDNINEVFNRPEVDSIKTYRASKRGQHGYGYGTESVIVTKYHKIYAAFSFISRHLEHMHHYIMHGGKYRYDEEERNIKLRHMRINYLNNEMTKDEYKVYLANEEKKRDRMNILSQPIDTLYNAGADILRRAIPSPTNIGVDLSIEANRTIENYNIALKHGFDMIEEYKKLVEFINNIYKDISFEFNISVPLIENIVTDRTINYVKEKRDTKRVATAIATASASASASAASTSV